MRTLKIGSVDSVKSGALTSTDYAAYVRRGRRRGMAHTVFRTCTLCEAMCGLRFEVEDQRILSVRGDDEDVFSRGYICPKGVAIAAVHDDPDRVRQPLRRTA